MRTRTLAALALTVLSGCAMPGGGAGSRSVARPSPPPVSFDSVEGVYAQAGRSFLVTYQGWWVDTATQALRQLRALGGTAFDYGPGWMVATPVVGRVSFQSGPEGRAQRVTGTGEAGLRIDATRVVTTDREVRFQSGDATLAGTLTLPPGPASHAGVVVVHGSGPSDRREENINTVIFASLGMAVLAYDKRGIGASGGTYPGEQATAASIPAYAADAAAAARFLMGRPEIDPTRVGFAGGSQAGWIIPLATEQVPGLRYDVILSGPTVSTDQQEFYASLSSGSTVVPALSDSEIDARVRAVSGGYDPAAALLALTIPTLWMWGDKDRQVPMRLGLQDVAALHRPNWEVDVLPGGSHALLETANGLVDETSRSPGFAGDYYAKLRAWLAANALS